MKSDLLPKLILCADDDEDDRELISQTIAEMEPEYKIITAQNGIEVLSKLEQLKTIRHLPCLIILDMNMPMMGGDEALAQIKSDAALKKIPVVIFTTSPARHYNDLALKHGVDIVTKPTNLTKINHEISKLLSYCL